MDKYTPNTKLIINLLKYGITQSAIASFRHVSDAAVSKMFKTQRFTMLFIDDVATLASFPLGCFQILEGGHNIDAYKICDRIPAQYRLFYMVADLMCIYKSVDEIERITGVRKKVLGYMQETVEDKEHGALTPRTSLAKILFDDYLTLLSHFTVTASVSLHLRPERTASFYRRDEL